MLTKFPKNTYEIHWTDHVKRKMIFYGLSEQKIRNVMRNFKRKEDGVAPNTAAFMQRNDKPKRKEEIWVMVQDRVQGIGSRVQEDSEKRKNIIERDVVLGGRSKKIIISAWRYPGVSKVRDGVPVPVDVMEELERYLNN